MMVTDNGLPSSINERLELVNNHFTVQHGALPDYKELFVYSLNHLQFHGGHRVGQSGVNGNMELGCDAIILKNNDAIIGELNCERVILTLLIIKCT